MQLVRASGNGGTSLALFLSVLAKARLRRDGARAFVAVAGSNEPLDHPRELVALLAGGAHGAFGASAAAAAGGAVDGPNASRTESATADAPRA